MPRMGNPPTTRTRTARFGGVLGALLAAATVFAVAPAGASSQDVHFSLTPISFGSVVLGTSTTGHSIVTNNSGLPLYYISSSPGARPRRRVPRLAGVLCRRLGARRAV